MGDGGGMNKEDSCGMINEQNATLDSKHKICA